MIDKDFEYAGKFLGFDVFEAKEGLEGRVIMTTEIQMRHTDTFKQNEIFTIEDQHILWSGLSTIPLINIWNGLKRKTNGKNAGRLHNAETW